MNEKQEQLRFLSQKNLNLARSREQWKAKALEEKERVKQLEKEIEKLKKKESQTVKIIPEIAPLKVKEHHYTAQTIKLSVEQVIEGGNSYRGVDTTMKIFSRSYLTDSPHYSSIRNWVGRIGLYELSRKKEKRIGLDIYCGLNFRVRTRKSHGDLWNF